MISFMGTVFSSPPARLAARIAAAVMVIAVTCGCAVTKIAAVPMRVGGAVVSAVPVVGGAADKTIGATADIID